MRGRVLAAFLLIAASTTGWGNTPQAAAAGPELRGENILRVSRSSETRVVLGSSVQPDRFGFRVRGSGDSAVALVDPRDPRRGIFVVSGTSCDGCEPATIAFANHIVEDGRVPAGTYRLLVLSKGRTTVELNVKGWTGRRVIAPDRPTRGARLDRITLEVPGSDATGTYAGGRFQEGDPEGGFTTMFMWWGAGTYAASGFGSCYYVDSPDLPSELAFAPGCPAGRSHPKVDQRNGSLTSGGSFLLSLFEFVPEGLGGWIQTAASEHHAGALMLTIR